MLIKISSALDVIADHLEAQGLLKQAYEIDKIADTLEVKNLIEKIEKKIKEKRGQDLSFSIKPETGGGGGWQYYHIELTHNKDTGSSSFGGHEVSKGDTYFSGTVKYHSSGALLQGDENYGRFSKFYDVIERDLSVLLKLMEKK